jgi:YidC/Oxa1 family membrane protein insertase
VRELFHGLFQLVAQAIVKLHVVTGAVFGEHSGLSWAAAIMLLTVCVRLAMYPLFLKQIKTQRTMQLLQPKIKELQKKHKGDRESLNAEMMKLYKEHNANPLAGCLPMLLQMPIFISLFQVLSQLTPNDKKTAGVYVYPVKFGLDLDTVRSFESAKIFGAPIGAGFKSPAKLLSFLDATPGPVKAVSIVLIVAMALTTFVTSKQMMGKNKPTDSSQATQQKILLYVMPAMLGLFGFQVAIGVLIYWTTTNLFSMGQQAVVMKRLGPVDPNARPAPAKAAGQAKAAGKAPAQTKAAKPAAKPAAEPAVLAESGTTARPAVNRRPNNRNTKRGKGRRGGRR